MIERGKKIFLCKPDLSLVTQLNGVQTDSVSYHPRVKDYAELSFTVDKYIVVNGEAYPSNGYDLLDVYLTIYLEDCGYFQMQYPQISNDGNKETKSVVAYSIEKEFEQKKWVGLKVNTGEKDSIESLVDGNLDGLGYPKEFVVFYNPNNPNLSLLHIILTKMPGWSVIQDEIDPFLWNKKIRIEEDEIGLYALLTGVIAPKLNCLIMFDNKNRRIKAYSRENLETYHFDTNIYITYRNLAKQIGISVDEDSVITRFNVEGGSNLNFRDVNFNDSHIMDYSYFLKEPYMSQATIDKINAWTAWKNSNRNAYSELSITQREINKKIYDIQYKVPNDDTNWTSWDGKTAEMLQENLDYYNSMLTSLQVSVDPNPQYDSHGNYIPWKINGEVDHARYLEALYDEDNEFGGYYTYYEVLNYVIPNIEAAMQNASSLGSADYVKAYETDWKLYGVEELEAKRRNYESQLEALSEYSKPWNQLTDEEKALYINDQTMYNSNGRSKYVEISGYLGSTSTSGSLLYYLNKFKNKLASYNTQLANVTSQRSSMVEQASINYSGWGFTADELKLIDTLTHDSNYTNENIFTTSIFTDREIIQAENELYDDAMEKLSEVSQPQFSFSVSLDNLLRIPEFAHWKNEFSLLNYFRLGIRDDYSVKLRMTGYEYNPCDVSDNLKIEFSSMVSSRSGRSDLTNLLNAPKSGSMGNTIGGGGSSNGSGDFDKEYITSLLQVMTRNSVFRDGVNGIIGNFTADNATIDTAKIHALAAGYIKSEKIDVDQLIADKAKIWSLMANVGMIKDLIFSEGSVTGTLDAVTVNAANITAGTLTADRLVIRGTNKSIVYALNNISGALQSQNVNTLNGEILTERTINADRIVSNSITTTQITTDNLRGTGGWINLHDGTFAYGQDRLTWNGSVMKIGNWTVLPSRFEIDRTSEQGGYRTGMQCLADGSGSAFYAGCTTAAGGAIIGNSAFYVTQAGKLYCNNAEIEGTIRASVGKIGGFTIGATTLSQSVIANGVEYQVMLNAPDEMATPGNYRGILVRTRDNDGQGTTGSWEYPYSVFYDGRVSCSKLNATGGTIGGWTITTNSIKGTTNNLTTGMQAPVDGATWAFAAGATVANNWGTAPFRVSHAGNLYASNATITGTITATGGTIANWHVVRDDNNRGTTAQGGHIYNTSAYGHAQDSNYEYEVGLKADSGSNSAGYVAFYVKRITSGAAWSDTNATDMFFVRNNGSLYAANADITGKITATSGNIAGWTITGARIEKDNTSDGGYRVGIQNAVSGVGSAFYAGCSTAAGGAIIGQSNFYVRQDGYLFANNVNIEGTITSESGKIGGFTIEENRLYNGNYISLESYNSSYSKARMLIGNASGKHTVVTDDGVNMYAADTTNSYIQAKQAYFGGTVTVNGVTTFNANAHVSKVLASGDFSRFRLTNANPSASYVLSGAMQISSTGAFGLYNITNSRWLIYDKDGVVFPTASTVSAKMTFSTSPSLDNGVFLRSVGTGTVSGNEINLVGLSNSNNLWIGDANYYDIGRLTFGHAIDSIYCYNASGTAVKLSTAVSDRRLKHDIEDLENSKDFIMGLKAARFKLNGEKEDRFHFGFIAQDVRPLMETTVGDAKLIEYNPLGETDEYDKNNEKTFAYSMDYTQFIAPHIALTQEHEKRIAELEEEIRELKEIIRRKG